MSEQPIPGTGFACAKHGAGRSAVPYLALHPMGFSVPPRLRLERWALTPPFHPYPRLFRGTGGLIFCGTVRREASRLHRPRVSRCQVTRHRALWSSDFPPPSGGCRTEAVLRPSKIGVSLAATEQRGKRIEAEFAEEGGRGDRGGEGDAVAVVRSGAAGAGGGSRTELPAGHPRGVCRWLKVRLSHWPIWSGVPYYRAKLNGQLERAWWPGRSRTVRAPVVITELDWTWLKRQERRRQAGTAWHFPIHLGLHYTGRKQQYEARGSTAVGLEQKVLPVGPKVWVCLAGGCGSSETSTTKAT